MAEHKWGQMQETKPKIKMYPKNVMIYKEILEKGTSLGQKGNTTIQVNNDIQ